MSDIIATVCADSEAVTHFFMREMVTGEGGLLEKSFCRAEMALVAADDVLQAIVCAAVELGLQSEEAAAAIAAEAAKRAKTNFVFPAPSSLKMFSSEPPTNSPPAAAWFNSSCLAPSPAASAQPVLGHSLFLLMRTMANLCGCTGGSGNIPRKTVMQAGAAPFLVAALIPKSKARVWGCGGGVLKLQPMVGVEDVAGDWADGVREEAAGTLSNLALAPQARAALIKACILDVIEEVGHWACVDNPAPASTIRSSSSSIVRGARLLHETSAFVERCASVVKSLSQDGACRRRIRSSSKLLELNALAPQQLQDYKFFRARADGRDSVYWGGSLDLYAARLLNLSQTCHSFFL
jgi:hypothetical protein